MAGREKEDEDILTFLDTLEVKEVDLEKDVDAILETNDWNYDKIDFYEFAKHFFELGLEIQKGETELSKVKGFLVRDKDAKDQLIAVALETVADNLKLESLSGNVKMLALHNSADVIAEEVYKLAVEYKNKQK